MVILASFSVIVNHILKLFDCYTITENNFPPLIAEQSITSNIQIACNYLKNISQIDKIMLNFPGLTIKNDEDSRAIYAIDATDGNLIRKAFIKKSNLEEE